MSTQRAQKSRARRKKLRVLVLMHEDLVPPEDIESLSEADFNRIIEIKEREKKRVEIFMSDTNQREKTLVFCANQAHAAIGEVEYL